MLRLYKETSLWEIKKSYKFIEDQRGYVLLLSDKVSPLKKETHLRRISVNVYCSSIWAIGARHEALKACRVTGVPFFSDVIFLIFIRKIIFSQTPYLLVGGLTSTINLCLPYFLIESVSSSSRRDKLKNGHTSCHNLNTITEFTWGNMKLVYETLQGDYILISNCYYFVKVVHYSWICLSIFVRSPIRIVKYNKMRRQMIDSL